MKKSPKNKRSLRRIIQILFFVLIAAIAVNHTLSESGGGGIPLLSQASTHALCPFGGVVSLYQYFTDSTFVKKIHESSFILMGIVFFLALLFGPVFCGWVCPFGTFQELLGKLGKRINKKRFNKIIPAAVDSKLRYLRYGLLLWVLFMTARSGILLFQNIDPYYALFNFWTGEVAISGLIALGVVMILSLFVERPFCKYACPYGAVLGIFNLFRLFGIKRNKETCISCGKCDRECPMNITVSHSERIRNHQCISCLKCTSDEACPVEKTVDLSLTGHRVGAAALALIILLTFVGGIGTTMAFNLWSTESSKTPSLIREGDFAGEYNPADIRGSYSLEDIEAAFGVKEEVLARAFGFTDRENPGAVQIKELEDIYSELPDGGEVGTDSVRIFTALFKGLPYEGEETSRLPASAVKELAAKLSAEELKALEKITVYLKDVPQLSPAEDSQEAAEHDDADLREVKGNTTFGDLLQAGLSQEEIEEILGAPMGSRGKTVRDFAADQGVEFSDYKTALTELLENMRETP